MNLLFLTLKKKREDQSGINMVDLMMWLVIAALLLAAAIQGIGFYQQTAYVYQLQQATDVAAGRIVAASTTDGSIDADDADTVVAAVNAETPNDKITLSVETVAVSAAGEPGSNQSGFELASVTTTTVASGELLYIRATHDLVPNKDVVYFFNKTASQTPGLHLVSKGSNGTGSPSTTPVPTGTGTGTPTSTATATPTPTPTPTPTKPADVNATGITIVSNGGYPAYWTDKTVSAWTGNSSASFGFSTSQVSNTTQAANYTVAFTGGENIGAAPAAAPTILTGNGVMWNGTIRPVTGGFTEGVGYITATITDKTTGAFSTKTWTVTVTPQAGPVQGNYYASYWTDKSAPNMTSNSSAVFGFRIPFATASDYTVTYAGAPGIGANVSAVQTKTDDNGGTDWYALAVPVAGANGFTTGTGVITATVKYNPTGKTWTKTFNLTITESPGPVQGNYYASYWNNKTATVASTGSNVFGFAIKGAIASDFTVTFTSTGNVNENISATQFTTADGADWYAIVSAKAGGYTAGTSTITATATSKSTGKVFTKTYTLIVS